MNYESLSVKDIESYGSDIQRGISDDMAEIVKQARCIDLGKTNEYLSELSGVTNSVSKQSKITSLIPIGIKRWVARYESVESRLNDLSVAVDTEKEKLNTILDSLIESNATLREKCTQLNACEEELRGYLQYLDSNNSVDEDGLKRQACVNRLKVLVTTNSVVQNEIVKSVIVIKENKEIAQQLTEASENLLPMFNVMMMNTLASKANTEAIKMRKALVSTANKLVVENARQIEKNADELISGRTDSLVDVKSLEEANKILQRTVKKVIESVKSEEETNLAMIDSIRESMISIDSVKKLGE